MDPNFLPLNGHFLREVGLVQGETKVAISNELPTLFGDKLIIAAGKSPSHTEHHQLTGAEYGKGFQCQRIRFK